MYISTMHYMATMCAEKKNKHNGVNKQLQKVQQSAEF